MGRARAIEKARRNVITGMLRMRRDSMDTFKTSVMTAKGITKKIMKGASIVALAGFWGLEAFVHTNYFLKQARDQDRDVRRQLERIIGIPVHGTSVSSYAAANIADIVARENYTTQLRISSINVISKNFFERTLLEQVMVDLESSAGFYVPGTDFASVCSSRENITHELKHAKTFRLPRLSMFLEAWRKTMDPLPKKEMTFPWMMKEKKDSSTVSVFERTKRGYISSYAEKNVFENIAELCMEVEESNYLFDNILYGPRRMERISEQVDLAQKYGLIPAEFSQFIYLRTLYNASWDTEKNKGVYNGEDQARPGYIDVPRMKEFMAASASFLHDHPRSIYLGDVRSFRGNVIYSNAWHLQKHGAGKGKHDKEIGQAMEEYLDGLRTPIKTDQGYFSCIIGLEEIYKYMQDTTGMKRMQNAFDEHFKRRFNRKDPDLDFSHAGVDDILFGDANKRNEGRVNAGSAEF